MTDAEHPLLILGTRTFAEEVADLASAIPGLHVAGFVENLDKDRCTQPLRGLPVFWIDDIDHLLPTHRAVCALSTTFRSRFIRQAEEIGLLFTSLIHPSAVISAQTEIGIGAVIGAGSVIGAHSHLSPHVVVNRGALIGHHTAIGSFCSIQPGANVAGACSIGEAVYIGMGAIIIDHIHIGAHAVVGAGAVVTKDVPERVQVIGLPARIVKDNIDGR